MYINNKEQSILLETQFKGWSKFRKKMKKHINEKDNYLNTKNVGNTTKEMKDIYILILIISYSYFIGVISAILFYGGLK